MSENEFDDFSETFAENTQLQAFSSPLIPGNEIIRIRLGRPDFRETFAMIQAAFPNGIPEDAYEPLLVLLGQGMSYRAAASFLADCMGKDHLTVYNDLLKALSPFAPEGPNLDRIEEVRQVLQKHGYDAWLANEE